VAYLGLNYLNRQVETGYLTALCEAGWLATRPGGSQIPKKKIELLAKFKTSNYFYVSILSKSPDRFLTTPFKMKFP
jgi:hypothetical protein